MVGIVAESELPLRTPTDPVGFVLRLIGLWAVTSVITACATPAARFEAHARELGLTPHTVHSTQFRHRLYTNARAIASDARQAVLHVYLDGDGTPWEYGRWLSADPTSREPLILDLLAQDPKPALLLGRPCYHGFSQDAACQPIHWSDHRYAPAIVDALSEALKHWLAAHPTENLVLIGYSGGGSLAMLIAPHLPAVRAVVTLAANLDVAAWSHQHGYASLQGSLDPALQAPLPAAIRQLHFAGERDRNVPPALIAPVVARQPTAELVILEDFTHTCCWREHWPSLLLRIDALLEKH